MGALSNYFISDDLSLFSWPENHYFLVGYTIDERLLYFSSAWFTRRLQHPEAEVDLGPSFLSLNNCHSSISFSRFNIRQRFRPFDSIFTVVFLGPLFFIITYIPSQNYTTAILIHFQLSEAILIYEVIWRRFTNVNTGLSSSVIGLFTISDICRR